jgi:TPR repeat protein
VAQSDRKALVWLRRSALAEHVDAAVAAGLMCVCGLGVTAPSEERALNYFLFAAGVKP